MSPIQFLSDYFFSEALFTIFLYHGLLLHHLFNVFSPLAASPSLLYHRLLLHHHCFITACCFTIIALSPLVASSSLLYHRLLLHHHCFITTCCFTIIALSPLVASPSLLYHRLLLHHHISSGHHYSAILFPRTPTLLQYFFLRSIN